MSLKINQGMDKIKKLSGVDNLVVQKSRPLLSLWQSDFSLQELKILDVYLGRINSHDKEHRSVVFRKGELENIFGEVQIKPEILDKRLDHLMKTVKIPDPDGEDGFMRRLTVGLRMQPVMRISVPHIIWVRCKCMAKAVRLTRK